MTTTRTKLNTAAKLSSDRAPPQLDLAVYARAALAVAGADRYGERFWTTAAEKSARSELARAAPASPGPGVELAVDAEAVLASREAAQGKPSLGTEGPIVTVQNEGAPRRRTLFSRLAGN